MTGRLTACVLGTSLVVGTNALAQTQDAVAPSNASGETSKADETGKAGEADETGKAGATGKADAPGTAGEAAEAIKPGETGETVDDKPVAPAESEVGGATAPNPPVTQAAGAGALPEPTPMHFSTRGGQEIVPRWEDGLDAKLTGLFNRSANLTSPTIILSAQWNYRFPSDTYVGFTASAMPQANTDTTSTGIQRSFTTYYGGLNLAQGLFESGAFRIVATIAGGMGIVYERETYGDGTQDIGNTRYNFLEPGAFITFFNWEGLDIGGVATYRIAKLQSHDRASDADLSSATVGLTFRTRGW